MSGDAGLDEKVIFYHRGMTEAKKVVIRHKGIELAYLEINNQKEDGRATRFSIRGKSIQ